MVATYLRRQDTIGGGKTASIGDLGSSLALADSTNTANVNSPAASVTGIGATITLSSSATPSPSSPSSSGDASEETFSTGMVVGICVGAFLGAALIILVGVIIYRRTAPKQRQRRPSQHRRIESKGDSWEGKYPQTRQMPSAPNTASTVAPMEKLTSNLFVNNSPSIRSEEPLTQDGHSQSHNFVEYRPELAREMSMASEKNDYQLGQVDTGPALSWHDPDGGRMSPMFSKAIPTPQAHDSPLHHAQSAEVINPFGDDDDDDEVERRKSQAGNPFFGASAQNDSVSIKRTRSRAASRASRASSHYTDYIPAPRTDKGKGKAPPPQSSHGHGTTEGIDDMYASEDEDDGYYSAATNPFSDPAPNDSTTTLTQQPQLHIPNHPYAAPIYQTTNTALLSESVYATPTRSTPSPRPLPTPSPTTPVNDPRAIKGLLAALEIPDANVGGGGSGGPGRDLRATVMSAQSGVSAYSEIESGVVGEFPKPPGQY